MLVGSALVMKFTFLLLPIGMLAGCGIVDNTSGLRHELQRLTPKPCTDVACNQLHADEQEYWQRRASKIHPGMRRSEVERLLPWWKHPESGPSFIVGGSEQDRSGKSETEGYFLSQFFFASLRYDYTDSHTRPWQSPNQRALTNAVITHRHAFLSKPAQ